MSFISAFSYMPYLARVIYSIGIYRRLKDVTILSSEIGQILVEVVEPYLTTKVDMKRLRRGIEDVVRAIEEAM